MQIQSIQHTVFRSAWLPVLFLFLSAGAARAQEELMLHTMPEVWHATSTNPALFPEKRRIYISLPAIGLDAAHSGNITYRDVFVKQGDRTIIDFSNVISRLDPLNKVRFDQRNEVFGLGIRLPGNFLVQAGYANRLNGVLEYPRSLPELLWNGNAPYIGQTLDISVKTDISDYNEWSVGVAKTFGSLTVGARAKLLAGVSSLRTDPDHNKATVYTSDDIYQLSLHTDYGIYSSSLISSIDTSDLGFDITLADVKRKWFSKNLGTAFDLGLRLKVNDRITLDASVLDLGASIKWDSKASYHLSQGDYEYEGQVFPGTDLVNGTDSLDFDSKIDTLNDIFHFEKTDATFTTKLPLRGYFGASFKLSDRWTFGLSGYFSQRETGQDLLSVGASARWKLFKWLTIGSMYSINNRSAANIGFNASTLIGPIQLYLASDNLFNAFSVKNSPAVNFRAGVSLLL